jgi:predicted amidohydrolase YtcJ
VTTLYRNARVFTADESAPWAEAFVVDAGKLTHVGSEVSAQAAAGGPQRSSTSADGWCCPGSSMRTRTS